MLSSSNPAKMSPSKMKMNKITTTIIIIMIRRITSIQLRMKMMD